ncbi:hypothetical protein [Paraburkholderia fungorum]|uniref:hypothetical protein n=1 Tax=Paraburkholderia fungorum TaxID=134537 RepID=UPI0038B9ACA2
MTNAISSMGNSTPFDMGNMPAPAQGGTQTDAQFASVRMFSPDNTGDAGNAQPAFTAAAPHAHASHAHHAAADGDGSGAAAQDAGAAAQGGGGNGMSGAMSQIMDIIKTVISAAMQLAPPLLGMFTSMMGKAGTSGAGTA